MKMLLQSSAYNKRVKCDARTSRALRGRYGSIGTGSMNLTDRKIKLLAAGAILFVVAILGVWLGEYGWFGGYISTKERIGFIALFLGVIGSGLLCQKHWISLATIPLYFVASQLLFFLCIALGQTWYLSPDPGKFKHTFWLALQGQL